jgi:hypothetical protein
MSERDLTHQYISLRNRYIRSKRSPALDYSSDADDDVVDDEVELLPTSTTRRDDQEKPGWVRIIESIQK